MPFSVSPPALRPKSHESGSYRDRNAPAFGRVPRAKGIITVQWDVLEATYAQSINSKALTETISQFAQRLGDLIPVSGGFVAGFLLGFRAG